MKLLNDNVNEDMFRVFIIEAEPLILTFAELMKVSPNPRNHPFMLILKVSIRHLRCNSCVTQIRLL